MEVGKAARVLGQEFELTAISPAVPVEAPIGTGCIERTDPNNSRSILTRFKDWLRRNALIGTPAPAMPRGQASVAIASPNSEAQPQPSTWSKRASQCCDVTPMIVGAIVSALCGLGGAGVPRAPQNLERESHNSYQLDLMRRRANQN